MMGLWNRMTKLQVGSKILAGLLFVLTLALFTWLLTH